MKKTTLSLTALGLLLGWSPALVAQSCAAANSCQVTTTASVTVPALVSLDVSGGGALSLTPPGANDLTTGYVEDAGPTFTLKANRAWTLSVHTTNATDFTYTGTQGGVKPISDMTWSTTSGGTYAAITGTAASVTTGTKTNGASPSLFFRTLYSADFSDDRNAAGSYSMDLVFTVSAP